MCIPWNCIGTPGWVDAMDIFHGKLMWGSPCASHGIALGLLDGWMPWTSSMVSSWGETPWASHGLALGLLDGWMPWTSSMARSCGETPWASHGIVLGLLDGWMPWIS